MVNREQTQTYLQYDFIREPIVQQKWCTDLVFLLMIKGRSDIWVEREEYSLQDGDIIMVHPFRYFCIPHIEGICLLLRIHVVELQDQELIDELPFLSLNSSQDVNKQRFYPVIEEILSVIEDMQEKTSTITEKKYIYSIYEKMLKNHHNVSRNLTCDRKKESTSWVDIMTYMEQNYARDITLSEVAKFFYISESNLSKLFIREINTSFSKYLKHIRLMHATNALLKQDISIEEIACQNGFSSPRTFSNNFREYYGVLPSEFRLHDSSFFSKFSTQESLLEEKTWLQEFKLQISDQKSFPDLSIKKKFLPAVSVQNEQHMPAHHTHDFLTIRKASHLLIQNNQKQISEFIHRLGFSCIYMHEFLHDDMEICFRTHDGSIRFNFYKVDQVMDFIVENHVTPYIELAYIPFALAEDIKRSLFNSILNMPKDITLWNDLIENLLQHLIMRYGIEQVITWKFCVWNSPDNVGINYLADNVDAFYQLYENTYRTIKKIHPDILVGPAALMGISVLSRDWMNQFAAYYTAHDCTPDFYMVNMYTAKPESNEITPHRFPKFRLSTNPSDLLQEIQTVKQRAKQFHWNIPELIIPEWNYQLGVNDPDMEDSIYKAVYIVKNMVDCFQENTSFGIADPIDSYPFNKATASPFHGRFGLISYNYIRKPSYYAYLLLNQMGDTLLWKDDGCLITKSDKTYQILLYNYHHFSDDYANRLLDTWNAATVFPNVHYKEFQIPITDLKPAHYQKIEVILNTRCGNPYLYMKNNWADMALSSNSVSYLNETCQPMIKKELLDATEEGNLILSECLEPFEIRLITLKRV